MKKINVLILFLTLSITTFAQNKEERKLSSFSKLDVGQAINVHIEKNNVEKARIETDGIDTDDVLTDVSGGTLKIRLDKNGKWKNVKVTVYLTYKNLDAVSVSSAANVYTKNTLKADKLEVDISSAGGAELDVDIDELEIDISSSGKLEISGSAKLQEISVSSAGSLDAYNLECTEATARVSSAGSARLTVTKRLEAKASSGGSIKYKGDPEKTHVNSGSGGSVRKSQ